MKETKKASGEVRPKKETAIPWNKTGKRGRLVNLKEIHENLLAFSQGYIQNSIGKAEIIDRQRAARLIKVALLRSNVPEVRSEQAEAISLVLLEGKRFICKETPYDYELGPEITPPQVGEIQDEIEFLCNIIIDYLLRGVETRE